MRRVFSIVFMCHFFAAAVAANAPFQDSLLMVYSCSDFMVTGKGDHAQWQKAEWVHLNKLDKGGKDYKSRFKILYSNTGIYVLFNGEDSTITSSFTKDFDKIYKGDVFEVFFHTDDKEPVYFEYEVSPLAKELVLLLTQRSGIISGWAPWPYESGRVQKKVFAQKNKAGIRYWTAELFIPYSLLSAFENVPPVKGSRWKANFCRLDHDTGAMIKWAWAPVDTSFHELHRFYSLVFD
jgi:hypothetical protein